MDPYDFYVIVLPLASLITILATITFYYAQKEEHTSVRLNYIKERLKALKKATSPKENGEEQSKAMNEEYDRLKDLRKDNSIDEITYKRLKKILKRARMIEAGYEPIISDLDGKMHFRKRKGEQANVE